MNEWIEAMLNPLVGPIVLALLAGAVAYVASRVAPLQGKVLALAAGLVMLLGGVMIARGPADQAFSCVWVDLGANVTLSVDLVRTPLGMLVMIAAAAFALLITVYSFSAMAGEYWEGKFYAYLIWSLAGTGIVALAGNLLVLLVGWELVTLMLFLMINQGRGDARSGAAKAYGVLGFADACLMLAVALLIGQGGTKALSLTAAPIAVGSMGATGYVIYALIMVAALAKAGAVPLHTWIPTAAKDAPSPVMALLPGALDKLLGIYLLAVLALRMFQPDATMGTVLLVVGCVTLLGAGFMALMQSNLNQALAFDAVSQVGYMAIGIGAGTWLLAVGGSNAAALAGAAVAGALFHMLNHAIYKSCLFLLSGTASKACGTAEMRDMGGLARVMPVVFGCGLIAALAAAGVPPMSGFASKWLVFQGALGLHRGGAMVVLLVAVFASAMSLALFVKILYAVFLSPPPAGAPAPSKPKGYILLAAPMVVLAATCVLFGLRPHWITHWALGSAVEGVSMGAATAGTWQPAHATALIVLGVLGGLTLVWVATRGAKIRVVRPFLGGEVPVAGDDRFRLPGTHLYRTISKLPIIGPLLAHGQDGAMDLYYWSGKHGHTFVEVLRSAHTGLVSLYVAWCLLGLTVTLIYLLLSARA